MHWAQVKTGIQHALLLNVTQKMLNSISFKNHAARNYTNQTSTVHNYQQETHLQLLNNLIRGVKKNLPCLDVRIFIKSSKFCFSLYALQQSWLKGEEKIGKRTYLT